MSRSKTKTITSSARPSPGHRAISSTFTPPVVQPASPDADRTLGRASPQPRLVRAGADPARIDDAVCRPGDAGCTRNGRAGGMSGDGRCVLVEAQRWASGHVLVCLFSLVLSQRWLCCLIRSGALYRIPSHVRTRDLFTA